MYNIYIHLLDALKWEIILTWLDMKDSAQTMYDHCTETHVNLTVIFFNR